MRAVVVGAGFAGLAAAEALQRNGVEVVVLEARDRVGGRVWSRELGNGSVVELGAEFILPGNTVLLGLVKRFGLGLWSKGMRYGEREPRGGIGVDRATLLAAGETVRDALRTRPGAARLSAGQLLDALALHPGAREALRARVEVSSANLAEEVSATALADIAAHTAEACPSIAGGNQRVAHVLAGELGGAVHLSTPVERIAWSDAGVRVTAAAAEVAADVAVIAVPASVIGRIAFEPELPEEARRWLAGIVYGRAAKLFVPLASVPQPSAVLSVPERYWTWTATAARGVQPVVHAFVGSAPALERLRVSEGPEAWVASVRRLRPDLELEPAGAVLSTWDDDPWVGAAYSTRVPAAAGDDATIHPVGPLHFCGEHTAGELAALMEGALRSGLRAAEELLRRLR